MVELEGIAPSRVKALLAEQFQSLHSGIAPFKWWTCRSTALRVSPVLTDALFTCLGRAWFPVRAAAAVFPAGFSGNDWPRTLPGSEDGAFYAFHASPLFTRNVAARRLTYRCVSIRQRHDIHRHLNLRLLLTRIRLRGMRRRRIDSVDRYWFTPLVGCRSRIRTRSNRFRVCFAASYNNRQ